MQVFFAILLAAVGVSNAQQQFPDVVKAKGAIRRVFGTLDREPLIDTASADGALLWPAPAAAAHAAVSRAVGGMSQPLLAVYVAS